MYVHYNGYSGIRVYFLRVSRPFSFLRRRGRSHSPIASPAPAMQTYRQCQSEIVQKSRVSRNCQEIKAASGIQYWKQYRNRECQEITYSSPYCQPTSQEIRLRCQEIHPAVSRNSQKHGKVRQCSRRSVQFPRYSTVFSAHLLSLPCFCQKCNIYSACSGDLPLLFFDMLFHIVRITPPFSQPANQASNCLFAFKYSGDCVIAFGTCTGCDDPFFGSCPGVHRP